MNKDTQIYGVDIGKNVFDVYSEVQKHQQYENSPSGFKTFLKALPKEAFVVMEATGYYHYLLAQFLHAHAISRISSKSTFCKTLYTNETCQSENR